MVPENFLRLLSLSPILEKPAVSDIELSQFLAVFYKIE